MLLQLKFDQLTRDTRVVLLRKVVVQDESLHPVSRIVTLRTYKGRLAQVWLRNLDSRLLVMVLCKDRTVDVWLVVKDVRSKTRNKRQFVQTQLVVAIRIKPSRCKAIKQMIRVWQAQAVTFSLTWTGSLCKVWIATTNSKWVPTISRRSSRQEKRWQLTRLRLRTARESPYLLLNFQTVLTT